MHIGIAGIGKMGAAIAQRLMEVGHQVTVWNRSADKTKPVVDAGADVGGVRRPSWPARPTRSSPC